jgi:AP-3 complex subunit delta-1
VVSQEHYQFVTNFEWYISVLIQLTRIEGTRHGKLIAQQVIACWEPAPKVIKRSVC